MARKINLATTTDVERIDGAIELLRRAREQLVLANAPRAADKVRSALRSAGGARRHVENRVTRGAA